MVLYKFHHFGHSFPRRLFQYVSSKGDSVDVVVGSPTSCRLYLDGHSGLTYSKIFHNPGQILARIKRNLSQGSIDVLSVDLGTNDLCSPEITVSELIERVVRFIKLLSEHEIKPKYLVFFSIIRRSYITRPGQVSINCFNHRVKKFNKQLAKRLDKDFTDVHMYMQDRVNFLKYLEDGCHFTSEGRAKYIGSLRRFMFKYKSLLQNV